MTTYNQNRATVARTARYYCDRFMAHPLAADNDLIALDRKLKELCETPAQYVALRMTALDKTNYAEQCAAYRAAIAARKEIRHREGHARARQIAQARALVNAHEWVDLTTPTYDEIPY